LLGDMIWIFVGDSDLFSSLKQSAALIFKQQLSHF